MAAALGGATRRFGDDAAAFQREKLALAIESARVARERAIGADDAMARNEDRQRVAARRGTGRTDGRRISRARGEIAISDGSAERHRADLVPHRALKRGTRWRERDVELCAPSVEILG